MSSLLSVEFLVRFGELRTRLVLTWVVEREVRYKGSQ
jgi:hypothetical protein